MKIFLLILLSMFISGCSVDYHLTIDENSRFYEDVLIKAENSIESDEIQNDTWPVKAYYTDPDIGENPEKLDGVSYYADTTFLENNYYYRKLTFEHPKSQFSVSNLIRQCYSKFYVTDDTEEKTVTLSTSAEFLCMNEFENLEEVHIQVEVKNPVISHNASNVNDNIYEWVINRSNYESSGIVLTYSSNPVKVEKKEDVGSRIWIAFLLLGGFVIFIIGVIVFKIKNQN